MRAKALRVGGACRVAVLHGDATLPTARARRRGKPLCIILICRQPSRHLLSLTPTQQQCERSSACPTPCRIRSARTPATATGSTTIVRRQLCNLAAQLAKTANTDTLLLVAAEYDWCIVPDSGYDVIVFAGVAVVVACLFRGKFSNLMILIAGLALSVD